MMIFMILIAATIYRIKIIIMYKKNNNNRLQTSKHEIETFWLEYSASSHEYSIVIVLEIVMIFIKFNLSMAY